jgi:hypothetical protein
VPKKNAAAAACPRAAGSVAWTSESTASAMKRAAEVDWSKNLTAPRWADVAHRIHDAYQALEGWLSSLAPLL